jgi:DNA polymerase I-like protein with 3'-5' exonuclease and polymerase domains
MAEKGTLLGLDGRRILVRHQHAALNTLLQGAGAISCKQWSICMDEHIRKHRLRAHLVNTIHDEMQFEVHVDDVEKIISSADLTMRKAGNILGVRLPLNADAKLGFNWAETH